jgi:hypothetical protein
MSKLDSNFFSIVPKLTKDPLGIIALFIALVYAIAALILGLGSHLTATQKWPFIGFLVGFPVIVLISFLWLVVNYNQKLYSPEDYRSDKAFLKTLKPGQQVFNGINGKDSGSDKKHTISQAHSNTKKKTAQKSTSEKYRPIVAEDLVLRDLEIEMDVPFRRQLGLKSDIGGDLIPFNGIAALPDEIITVYIKYLDKKNGSDTPFYAQLQKKMQSLENGNIKRPIRCFLAIITENYSKEDTQHIKNKIKQLKENDDDNIHIRWYDANKLLKKYKMP